MQRSKLPPGVNQGYAPRPHYGGPPENRQFTRGDSPYHLSGNPGAGPGMRALHHSAQQQPPTPPTPQEMKQTMTAHMQQQPQQLISPQQSVAYNPGNQRAVGVGAPAQFHTRGPAPQHRVQQRLSHPSAQNYQGMPPPQMHVQYPMHNVGVPQHVLVNNSYQNQLFTHNPQRASFYPVIVQQPYQPYAPPNLMFPPMRAPGPVGANPQVMPPPQHTGMPPVPSQGSTVKARPNAILIIDPNDGHIVTPDPVKETSPPRSGDSSARETPQPTVDKAVVAEFARKVVSSLGDEASAQSSSRNSNFSESDSQASPVLQQNASPSGIASPKVEIGPEVVSEAPIVDNNMGYIEGAVRGWNPGVPVPMEISMGMPLHSPQVVVMPEEMIRQREYQHMPPSWTPDGPPQVGGIPIPPAVVKKVERSTPVVSALAVGPTVDIGREFPALGGQRHGGPQSPARNKRRQQPRPEAEPFELPPPVVPPQPTPVLAPVTATPPVNTIVPEEQVAEVVAEPLPPANVVEPPPPTGRPIRTFTSGMVPQNVVEELPSIVTAPNTLSSNESDLENVSQSEPVHISTGFAIPSRPADVSPPTSSLIGSAEPPTSTSPVFINVVDAKPNHHKKSSKRQQQRQELQQQRQTPPPEPVAVTPSSPPEPQRVRQPTPPPEVVALNPPPQSEPLVVETQTPVSAPVVEEVMKPTLKEEDVVEERDKSEQLKEERLVAAMNEENKKMSAALPLKPTIVENNNVSEKSIVSVVVDSPIESEVFEPTKPVLKHNYEDDQWSPINPDGKKRYGREFIMELMNDPQSRKRPENLPQLELLKDVAVGRGQPMNRPMSSNRHADGMMMPNFSKSTSFRSGGSMKGSSRQSSQLGKPKSNKPMPIQVSISLNEEVKLRESATPWKPARINDPIEPNEEDAKTDILYKKVRGVLNKLTPEKFSTLSQQVMNLPIDTKTRLSGVIDLVFEKAVEEPGFSVVYAEMCNVLSKLAVPYDDPSQTDDKGERQVANFRVLLLCKCQDQFERDSDTELNRNSRLKEIDDEPDPEKKKELLFKLEEDERKIRIRSVGNIRFIGELFKMKMLKPNIMYKCIEHLLKLNSEESLECLCKLLTTIGKDLDADRNPKEDYLGIYFANLKDLVKNKKKISSRVRFMIQDLIDLRKGDWIPRRDDAAPKKMGQIVREEERQQIETNLALSSLQDRRPGGGGGRQDSRNSKGGQRGMTDNSEGWKQVNSNKRMVVDTGKLLQCSAGQNDIGSMSLGSRNQFCWTPGQPDHRNKRIANDLSITHNKYAVLDEKPISRSSSLKGTTPVHSKDRYGSSTFKSSAQDDARDLRSSQVGPGSVAQPSPVDSASVRDSTSPQEPAITPSSTAAKLSTEENSKLTQSWLDDYFMNMIDDIQEASAWLAKFHEDDYEETVMNIFLMSLEKHSKERRGASKLLARILIAGVKRQHFLGGLEKFLEMADDLMIDIPKVWEYLGELLADPVAASLGFDPILKTLGPTKSGNNQTIATIIKLLRTDYPDSALFEQARTLLPAYLGGPEPFKKFLRDYSIEFLENPIPAGDKQLNTDKIVEDLKNMLLKNDFDQITQWVELRVGAAKTEPPFIRALITALLDVSIVKQKNSSWKLELDTLMKHIKLLTRYIDNDERREYECLLAIQDKLQELENPKGVLVELCECLLDQAIISIDSFKNWKESKVNSANKGVCMYALTSFFNMLYEADD